MIRVTVRGLAGHKLGAALTAIAVVLGVAMISGTYVLTDTIAKAFGNIIAASYAHTSAVITATPTAEAAAGAASVPAGLLARVRALPEVEAAAELFADLENESQPVVLTDTAGRPMTGGAGAEVRTRRRPAGGTVQPAGPGPRALGRRAG
jgi:putative ABC transport system permease protein